MRKFEDIKNIVITLSHRYHISVRHSTLDTIRNPDEALVLQDTYYS